MKNLAFSLLLIASAATGAYAQISLETGVNLGNLAIKSGGQKLTTKMKTGATFGIVADMPVADNVYFQTGVFYEMGGATITGKPEGEYLINSLGFPLYFVYKSGERCGSRFFIGGGPFVGYNLSGSYSISEYGPIPAVSKELTFGNVRSDLKKTDLGFGVVLGYQFTKHFYMRLRYHAGLTNLNPAENKDNTVKTSAIGITAGYIFGRCRGTGMRDVFRRSSNNHWRGIAKGVWSTKVRYRKPKGPGL